MSRPDQSVLSELCDAYIDIERVERLLAGAETLSERAALRVRHAMLGVRIEQLQRRYHDHLFCKARRAGVKLCRPHKFVMASF